MIRRYDVVNGLADLEHLKTYYNIPVFQGCTDTDPSQDEFADLDFAISKGSGMIQLRQLLPLDKVYQKSHFSGTIGATWFNHHSQFCEFVQKYGSGKILEIGGGHGALSIQYLNKYPNADWTIIDPLTTLPANSKVTVINEFFSENSVIDSAVGTITHSHFLEHLYDPSAFFDCLSTLPLGTKLIFSVPNIEKHFFDLKYVSSVSFEHSYMCSSAYIQYWLQKSGFSLIEKKVYGDDHSFFFAAVKEISKEEARNRVIQYQADYHTNKHKANDYFAFYDKLIEQLNTQLPENYYMFGANPPSQFLISQGIKPGAVCVLDNDPNKQNKRLYGTELQVKSPEILRDVVKPIVVLANGPYAEEVKNDILTNINPNTVFKGNL